jgi:hypothetical protein
MASFILGCSRWHGRFTTADGRVDERSFTIALVEL